MTEKQNTFKFSLGNFSLQSGETLNDAFLIVDVQGELNSAKSNAIVFATCFGGDHNFNQMGIGEGRALDPTKYCIISPNLFCSGQSSSPSNASPSQGGSKFPLITYYDNINAQDKLLQEYFGITNPLLYIGFSMGAQQAFHWGALHGSRTGGIVPICGTAKTTFQNWIALEGCKLALTSDAAFDNGNYTSPPSIGLKAFSMNYTSRLFDQKGYEEKLHLSLFGGLVDDNAYFQTLNDLFSGIDANNLLGMAKTWQHGDIGKHEKFGGNTAKALSAITCPALVMPSSSDISFVAEDNIPEVEKMPNAELRSIDSKYGHFAGSMSPILSSEREISFIDNSIKELLQKID
jgi:homoserine O-acetyltransferase